MQNGKRITPMELNQVRSNVKKIKGRSLSALALSLFLAFGLAACSDDEPTDTTTEPAETSTDSTNETSTATTDESVDIDENADDGEDTYTIEAETGEVDIDESSDDAQAEDNPEDDSRLSPEEASQ